MSLKGTREMDAAVKELMKQAEQEGMSQDEIDQKVKDIANRIYNKYQVYTEEPKQLRDELDGAKIAVKRARMQRNIAIVIAIFLLSICTFLALQSGNTLDPVPSEVVTETVVPPVRTFGNYVASINGSKYHLPSCQHAENILAENIVYYITETEAQKDGKAPCSVCKP